MQTKNEYKKRSKAAYAQTEAAQNYADRVPPQAMDVERSILGSMLYNADAVDAAIEALGDDSFYSEAHAKIFACIRDLSQASSPVDITTVAQKLRDKGWLEDVGSEAYLGELTMSAVTAGNIQYYAQIINEKAILRRLIGAAADITTDCFSGDREPQEVLDAAEAKVFGISEARVKNQYESVGQMLPRVLEEIHSYSHGGTHGIPTGFTQLDEMTTGLQKGDLVIVGGRPSMGKTAFCLSIALHASLKEKHPTVIFSLEMSKDQILQRLLCGEARINMHTMRSGKLNHYDKDKLTQVSQMFSDAPLYIDDTPAVSVLELRAKARRIKSQHGLGLIIVDYLQLMRPGVKTDSMQQDIAQISRSLKAVARELEVPVIALSQLSRAVEQRSSGDGRPQLSDLRESGAIEQDADVVMFVYRPEVYEKDQEKKEMLRGRAEIIVGKQRNGPIGDVEVTFVHKFARFENAAPADLPEDFG